MIFDLWVVVFLLFFLCLLLNRHFFLCVQILVLMILPYVETYILYKVYMSHDVLFLNEIRIRKYSCECYILNNGIA